MDVLIVGECSVQYNAKLLRMGCVLLICPVPFHLERSLRLFVPQVECHNLGFVWVCTQIVGSVVLCEFAQRFYNSCFHFYDRGLLRSD